MGYPASQMSVPTPHRKVILVNLGMIFVILASFEVVVRTFFPHNESFAVRRASNVQYQSSGFVRFVPYPNQTIFEVRDGAVAYDHVVFRFNQYGYRGEDFPLQKHSDEVRIAIFGGSHVFDQNSLDYMGDFGFPQLIQNRLRRLSSS